MKILVVGCGSAGRRHASNARAMAEVALCDIDAEKAKACASAVGARWFTDFEQAIGWAPDAVIVATPPSSHLAVAGRGLDSGAHLLVEKPLSFSLAGVEALLGRADRLQRKVFVGCNMRFHPAIQMVKQHLTQIGRPLFARASFGSYLPDMRPGTDYRAQEWTKLEYGGILLDCIHEFDYLAWMFGPAAEVTCVTGQIGNLGIEGPDYAWASVRHANGVRSEIHFDYLQRPKRRTLEVTGAEGSFAWVGDGKGPERGEVRLYERTTGTYRVIWQSDAVDANAPYVQVMRHFVDALAGASVPLATGHDGTAALATALAAAESAAAGSSVRRCRAA